MSLLFALLFNLRNLVFFSLSFLVTLRSSWQPEVRVTDMLEFANKYEIDFLYLQMEDKMVFWSCLSLRSVYHSDIDTIMHLKSSQQEMCV